MSEFLASFWGLVIGTLGDNLFLLLFSCVGYATGLFLTSTIENKIALGTSNFELIANDESKAKIIEYLKEMNKEYSVQPMRLDYMKNMVTNFLLC